MKMFLNTLVICLYFFSQVISHNIETNEENLNIKNEIIENKIGKKPPDKLNTLGTKNYALNYYSDTFNRNKSEIYRKHNLNSSYIIPKSIEVLNILHKKTAFHFKKNTSFSNSSLIQILNLHMDAKAVSSDHTLKISDQHPNVASFFADHVTIVPTTSKKRQVREAGRRARGRWLDWPVRRTAEMEGDVLLGGLMMVHEREDSRICGPIMPQGGIQALETMLFTLDYIKKERLLPGFSLGAFIHDDCDKDSYGLELAVDFIKGSISNINDEDSQCADGSLPEVDHKVISGVVGAASSVTSIQVANLLRLFQIPQVSFFSTSPVLRDKQRFGYFLRTIPSDHHQAEAMAKIVTELGWTYVSIVYEDSSYGIKGFEQLEKIFSAYNICIAVKEKLVKDSGVAKASDYDIIVKSLLDKEAARGVIIFASDQEVAQVMKAVGRNNATGTFSWIGSDGWSARSLVSQGNEAEVEGTLSFQPQANDVKGFVDYFMQLTPLNNKRNPWFIEYWEDHFKCKSPGSLRTPYNLNYKRNCTGWEKVTRERTEIEHQLQFVSDAVMAFAYALKDYHTDVCKGVRGLCKKMVPIKGEKLLKHLGNVSFKGLSGDEFQFDKYGDGPARYNILHFKQVYPGDYEWIRVGTYINGKLNLSRKDIQFSINQLFPPSFCSYPCLKGQAKQYVEGESCCWHCYNCSTYQIVNPKDEQECLECDWGTLPSRDLTYCEPIPEVYVQPQSWWAIGAMIFSSLGVFMTSVIIGIFFRFNDTPVVRASGRELSYVLLGGIFLAYAMTFVFIMKPTDVVCGFQRFGLGFCFAVIYGALLTKTNRISRIFNAGSKTSKRPQFISPKSQLFICSLLILVQVLIVIGWCMMFFPRAINHYLTRTDNFLVCKASINASYIVVLIYPMILIGVCTLYAWWTRKIPEAFNESRYIGFTMYTTCVIWLAFLVVYFAMYEHIQVRITSTCVAISLSATVANCCLFIPKIYIVIFHPERNVRQTMMTSTKYSFRNTISVKSHRVDSGTQSEVIYPIEIPMNEKGCNNGGTQLLQARITASQSIQTCGGSTPCETPYCIHSEGSTVTRRQSSLLLTSKQIKDVCL